MQVKDPTTNVSHQNISQKQTSNAAHDNIIGIIQPGSI